jgi:hypothetical protein
MRRFSGLNKEMCSISMADKLYRNNGMGEAKRNDRHCGGRGAFMPRAYSPVMRSKNCCEAPAADGGQTFYFDYFFLKNIPILYKNHCVSLS